jgi:hypothetical protein
LLVTGEVRVDPEVLDAASGAITRVVDDHEGDVPALGGGDYGHAGLATATTTFRTQYGLAREQLVLTAGVLAGELTAQAASYRAVDDGAAGSMTSLNGGFPVPAPSPGPAPTPVGP